MIRTPTRRTAGSTLAALLALAGLAPAARAQAPAPGADSVRVVPGPRYRAGPVQRFLLGSDYRDLWTTPIVVEVLDLGTFAGGLEPVETGGDRQTRAVRFRGADGREYNFRSVDKELTPALPDYAKETLVDWIRQDQTSAQLPLAPLVATALLDAAGVPNAGPRLVVMPDDPRLGEFRAEFAGMLGTIELHPEENRDDPPQGFGGAVRVAGTDRLLEHLEEDPAHRVDSRAFLRARLMDVFMGDWDRHVGQWRWARHDSGGAHWWSPIPEDRDYAFVDYDGAGLAIARKAGLPRLVRFREEYADLLAMMANSLELNRRLLADLPRAAWDSTAADLQRRLTDQAIAAAVGTLPAPHRAVEGADLVRILAARRDRLPEMAAEYYALMAESVEIHGTDRRDRAQVRRAPDGSVSVRVFAAESGAAAPYFQRTFHPAETSEIRVFLHGGDDQAEVSGEAGRILVRVVGGGGDDRLEDRSGGPTAFHDHRGDDRIVRGPRTTVDTRPYEPPEDAAGLLPRQRRDWGSGRTPFTPTADWHPHAGPVIGGGPVWTRYGFRHDPYASRTALRVLYAPLADHRWAVEYAAELRPASSPRRLEALARVSVLDATRFHGYGNGSPGLDDERGLAWHRRAELAAAWAAPLGGGAELRAGPRLRYTEPRPAPGSPAAATRPYGIAGVAQAGASAALTLDTRDDAVFPRSGILLRTGAEGWMADGGTASGAVEGEASTYLSLPGGAGPVLALRAGGRRALGRYPFFDAAFVGGSRTLRGFDHQRFAGDGAFWGTGELRVPLVPANLVVRGRLGLSAFVDAGRVFHAADASARWHTGTGGGLWFATPLAVVGLHYSRGEGERLYLRLGVPF
jgi:hypothetical protein